MKMKRTIQIFLILLMSQFIKAQCPTEDINFLNQSQVDQFLVNYPNCTQLNVDVQFGESVDGNNAIKNLNAFSNITSHRWRIMDLRLRQPS